MVLSYTKNQTSSFKPFVANQIQMIKDHSSVAQWQYVPSKSSLADYGLRGVDGTFSAKAKMWCEGSKFLWEPQSSWKRDHTVEDIDINDPETKKEAFLNGTEVKIDILETLEKRFLGWNKMRRVFALVLKFKTNLLIKAFPKNDEADLHHQIVKSE